MPSPRASGLAPFAVSDPVIVELAFVSVVGMCRAPRYVRYSCPHPDRRQPCNRAAVCGRAESRTLLDHDMSERESSVLVPARMTLARSPSTEHWEHIAYDAKEHDLPLVR